MYILVQFDEDYVGPSCIPGVPRVVPIPRTKKEYTPDKGQYAGQTFYKSQFNLTNA